MLPLASALEKKKGSFCCSTTQNEQGKTISVNVYWLQVKHNYTTLLN
jgi:hypothetical protein